MHPTVRDFLIALDRLMPFAQARCNDCVGLQVGAASKGVARALVAPEPAPDLVRKMPRRKIDLLVTYQPLFEKPLRSLKTDEPVGKTVEFLAAHGCALIACHSAMDASPFGADRILADVLDLRSIQARHEAVSVPADEVKVAVFTPVGHENAIIEAIAQGGGGVIGKYSHCTFRSPGTGTYKPLEGANPWAGEVGRLESAEETRLEAIVPRERLAAVIRSVRAAHPYEEMAYDVYPLERLVESGGARYLLGELPRAFSLRALAAKLRFALGEAAVPRRRRTSRGPAKRVADGQVRRVAVCTDPAAMTPAEIRREGVDALLTGEMTLSSALAFREAGIHVVEVGVQMVRRAAIGRLVKALRAEKQLSGAQVLVV